MKTINFDAKSHIKNLNLLRLELQKPFSKKDFYEALKKYDLPHGIVFRQQFYNEGILKRVGVDQYEFTFANSPIHYTQLQKLHELAYKISTKYNNKYKPSKSLKTKMDDVVILGAIELLKREGFEIYYKNRKQV